ncbi:MAG TPA: hypothetical protein VFV70_15050, partial [Hyphomonadaceae bacterium]|nr:hypothetical protein [Hyphomonadaceae bacterium]
LGRLPWSSGKADIGPILTSCTCSIRHAVLRFVRERNMPEVTIRMLVMKNGNALAVMALALTCLSSCMGYPAQERFYVIVPASKTPSLFTKDLASLAKRFGMSPRLGQSTDDQGRTLYVLEANGQGMKLWGQNQPIDRSLDGSSLPGCGDYELDPGQYTVMFIPIGLFSKKDGAVELASRLKEEISMLGYDVRAEPIECSSFALSTGWPS